MKSFKNLNGLFSEHKNQKNTMIDLIFWEKNEPKINIYLKK